ncbi:hypothetical protein [Nocardioides pakistanensis]
MGTTITLFGVLVLIGFLGVMVFVLANGSQSRALSRREREELIGLRALVDDLKDTAWDHRELDSALSVIMIDKIREHERRNRELGS